MNVICVDDEPHALEAVERELRQLKAITAVHTFRSSDKVLEYLSGHQTDVALLDIQMQATDDGLTLARKIREQSPYTRIIFLTGYSEYAVDAFRLHASGYLLKPATKEDIEAELLHIQAPPPRFNGGRVRIQCFGNFEIFVDGIPLKFERSKTKELLAYLIDRRGASTNTGELCGVLWEDKPDSVSLRKQLRTLLADLSKNLKRVHAEEILVKRRNSYAVNVEAIDCDYYHFLQKDAPAVNAYSGQYMAQYSWAEMTLGLLAKTVY